MFEMLLVLLLIIITVISVMALGPRGSNRGYKKGSSSRCSSSSSLLCSGVRLWTVVFVGCCKVLECEQSVLRRSCHHISEHTAL